MKLRALMSRCGCFYCGGDGNPEISMVATDSRAVREGSIFVAIEGYRDNGIRYVEDAVRRGASAVVVEERFAVQLEVPPSVQRCTTENARRCALLLSRAFFDSPSKAMTLIGVTGTNGKTTVTYLMEAIFRAAGKNPGVVGTISYRYNGKAQKANNTTPDPVELQSLFSRMREGGVSHVVMEVSSHALAMERVLTADFDIAVFTNLSQDHLDFHGSMDEYFKAKALLFQGLEPTAIAVVNRDDPHALKLLSLTKARVASYALDTPADFRAEVLDLSLGGTRFRVNGKEFFTHLVGRHNVYNFLCAYASAKKLGIEDRDVEGALAETKGIPGRFQRVGTGKCCHVFVDYAHTPDALERLLEAAGTMRKRRIITVFGCGGDRDRGKRPLMGSVVERRSDLAIVTSDNPRTEDPLAIIEDIKKGLALQNHIVVPDRKSAIFKAVESAMPDDIVLIAGKGHEDYQILGDRTIHFDDTEVAQEALREFGKL